jgi:hypothetical protein
MALECRCVGQAAGSDTARCTLALSGTVKQSGPQQLAGQGQKMFNWVEPAAFIGWSDGFERQQAGRRGSAGLTTPG